MKPGNKNSYKSLTSVNINEKEYNYFSLKIAEQNGLKGIEKLPKSLKVLLENLLRYEDGKTVTKDQILALQKWLKDRKGRELKVEDILHYQKIIVALSETNRIMKEIDKIEIE